MLEQKKKELRKLREYVGHSGRLHKLDISYDTTADVKGYVRLNDILTTALIEDIILEESGVDQCI